MGGRAWTGSVVGILVVKVPDGRHDIRLGYFRRLVASFQLYIINFIFEIRQSSHIFLLIYPHYIPYLSSTFVSQIIKTLLSTRVGSQFKMKRSSSQIDNDNDNDDGIPSSPAQSQSGSDSEDFKPEITPPPTSKAKKATAIPKTPTPRKRTRKDSSDGSTGGSGSGKGGGGGNGEWTPEKKGILIDRVIAAGFKVLDIGELAKEVSSF